MVGRVLLDVNGLNVSKPGAEVTTAAAVDLIFNSNGGKFFAPIMTITLTPSSYVLVNSNYGQISSSEVWKAIVSYGQILPAPPIVFVQYRDLSVTNSMVGGYNISFTRQFPGPGGIINFAFTTVDTFVDIYADRVEFRTEYSWSNGYGDQKQPGPQRVVAAVGRV